MGAQRNLGLDGPGTDTRSNGESPLLLQTGEFLLQFFDFFIVADFVQRLPGQMQLALDPVEGSLYFFRSHWTT